jgi:nucleoid-associated protein YgaU
VGRETKFGLLVGLVFIVLFGVILSGRAGSSTSDHAVMPTGESQFHAERAQTMHSTVDPFVADSPLDMSSGTTGVPVVAEESLPAPASDIVDATPAPRPEDRVTVGYGPVTIETPGAGRTGPRDMRPDVTTDRTPITTIQPPADPSRPVYVVKQGDTLSGIAHQFYGREWSKYQQGILEANKKTLKDPKKLLVGMKLVIPGVPAATPKPAAPADMTRPAAPAIPATPAVPADPATLDYNDTGLALDGRTAAPRTVEEVRRALRDVTVPVDGRPTPRTIPATEVLPQAPPSAPSGKTYTIQAGDSFNKIAAKLYGDGNKYGKLLASKNPGVDPSRMKIGQKIMLVEVVPVATTETTTVAVLR